MRIGQGVVPLLRSVEPLPSGAPRPQGRGLVMAALIGLGIGAAIIGVRLLRDGGSQNEDTGLGREVGTAYGKRMVDLPDGGQRWSDATGPLVLARHLGAREGYETLAAAMAAVHPNAPDTDDMAFLRVDGRTQVFALEAHDLEAVRSWDATAPDVIAYTSPDSGDVFAGPAATAGEVGSSGLARR